MGRPIAPSFAAVEAAYNGWGANCGPTALAAATGSSLDKVRPAICGGGQTFKGYMGIRDIQAAMRSLDVGPVRTWTRPSSIPDVPDAALVLMILWNGPWSGIPRAAATKRHCITSWNGQIYDCNNYPDSADGWLDFDSWQRIVVPEMIPKRGDGTWSIAWAGQVALPRSAANGTP